MKNGKSLPLNMAESTAAKQRNLLITSGFYGRTLTHQWTDALLGRNGVVSPFSEATINRIKEQFYWRYDLEYNYVDLEQMPSEENKLTEKGKPFQNYKSLSGITPDETFVKGKRYLYYRSLHDIARAAGLNSVGMLMKESWKHYPENTPARSFDPFFFQKHEETSEVFQFCMKAEECQFAPLYNLLTTLEQPWAKNARSLTSPTAKMWLYIEANLTGCTPYLYTQKVLPGVPEWLDSVADKSSTRAQSENSLLRLCNEYLISYRWLFCSSPQDVFYGSTDTRREIAFDIFTVLPPSLKKVIASIIRKGDSL